MLTRNGKTFFTEQELACRHCGLIRFAPGFTERLLDLREAFGQPMTVTSACRCDAHNQAVGGNARSLHVADKPFHPTGGTMAVDVRSTDVAYNAALIAVALPLGWSCGVAKWGIHLDRRVDIGLPQAVFPY